MKPFIAAFAALSLGACSTFNAAPPPSVHLDAGKALVAAESAVDAAALAADVAVQAHVTTKAQDAQIAALVPTVQADLVLARQAYIASDAATIAALTAQLLALAGQLASVTPAH